MDKTQSEENEASTQKEEEMDVSMATRPENLTVTPESTEPENTETHPEETNSTAEMPPVDGVRVTDDHEDEDSEDSDRYSHPQL